MEVSLVVPVEVPELAVTEFDELLFSTTPKHQPLDGIKTTKKAVNRKSFLNGSIMGEKIKILKRS